MPLAAQPRPRLASVRVASVGATMVDLCAANSWAVTEILGFKFLPCTRDCYSAAVTDLLIAVHAAFMVARIKVHCRNGGRSSIGRVITCFVCANSLWCLEGSMFWLQPDGRRLPGPDGLQPWFEVLWRLNAVLQAVILYFLWRLVVLLLKAAHICAVLVRHEALVTRAALAHSCFFGVATSGLLPSSLFPPCQFRHYVLFGASNIVPPLMSVWLSLIAIVFTYWPHLTAAASERVCAYRARGSASIVPCHPLVLGVLSGSMYWAGNTGVLFGREVGPTMWARKLMGALAGRQLAPTFFEEMALFHVGTLLGNEMLFRCYEWLAAAEAQAAVRHDAGGGRHASLPFPASAWLANLLVERGRPKAG